MKKNTISVITILFVLSTVIDTFGQPNKIFNDVAAGVPANFYSDPSMCVGDACLGSCSGFGFADGIMYGLREGTGTTSWVLPGSSASALFNKIYNSPGQYSLFHRSRTFNSPVGCNYSYGPDLEYGTYTINVVSNLSWTLPPTNFICNNGAINILNHVNHNTGVDLVVDDVVYPGVTVFNAANFPPGTHTISARKVFYNTTTTLSSVQVNVVQPVEISNPSNNTQCPGATANFSVNTLSGNFVSYLWQQSIDNGATWSSLNGSSGFPGVFSASLTIPDVTGRNGHRYRVRAGNACGLVYSNPATLTVPGAVQITTQPANDDACPAGSATFQVTAVGQGSLSYQWQTNFGFGFGWENLGDGPWLVGETQLMVTGAGSANLSVANISYIVNGLQFRCVVTDGCGAVNQAISSPATLTVNTLPVSITSHPSNASVCPSSSAVFSVSASSATTLNYQWQWQFTSSETWYDLTPDFSPPGASFNGTNTASLTLTNATNAVDPIRFRCRIIDNCGNTAFTNPADIAVYGPVIPTSQPTTQTVCPGADAQFYAFGAGNGDLSFEWQVSGDGGITYGPISTSNSTYSGATSPTLTVHNVTSNLAADLTALRFRCRMRDACGALTEAYTVGAGLALFPPTSVLTHPSDIAVCPGQAYFSVNGSAGNGLLTYQWQVSTDEGVSYVDVVDGGIYAGANNNVLNLSSLNGVHDGYRFRVALNDACGAASTSFSNYAILDIYDLPEIITEPVGDLICPNGNATFSVLINEPADQPPFLNFAYVWQQSTGEGAPFSDLVNNEIYSGVNTPTLTLTNASASFANYQFRARITNCRGTVDSQSATLSFETPVEIIASPMSAAGCFGSIAMFSVSGAGSNMSYQWQQSTDDGTTYTNLFNSGSYSGVNTPDLSINGISESLNGTLYRCVLSGTCNEITSDAALLTVTGPLVMSEEGQPIDRLVCTESNTTFSVTLADPDQYSYQWQVSSDNGNTFQEIDNSDVYAGVTANTLFVNGAPVSLSNNRYRLKVTGACNHAFTNEAMLTVLPKPAIPNAADAARCGDGALSVTASSDVTSPTFHWYENQNDADPLYTGATFEVSNLTATSIYYVAVTDVCQSDRRPVTFTHHQYQSVPVGGTLVLCSAQAPYNLENDITEAVAKGSLFTWTSAGNTVNSNEFDPAIGLGIYTVTYEPPLAAQTAPHCYTTATRSIQVTNTIGEGGITFSGDKVVNGNTINLCVGDNAVALTQLPSLSGGSWSTVSGSGLSTAAPEFVPNANTLTSDQPNIVRYTLNVNGCIASKDLNVFVRDNQQVPVITGVPTIVCPGTTITIGASVVAQGNFSFHFYKSGESVAFATTPNLNYPVTTQEVLEVRSIEAQSGCRSQPTLITLNTPVLATGIVVDKATIDVGESVQFATDALSSSTFLWQFGDGATSTEARPTHKYSEPGEFSVNVTISQNPECPQELTFEKIVVSGTPVTSVENKLPGITVYPNPTTNRLRISSEQPVIEVEVIDVLGQRQSFIHQGTQHDIDIDVRHLRPGLLALVLTTPVGEHVSKILKQ